MVRNDNPAGRLYKILNEARNTGDMPTIEMWAKVLDATDGSSPEVFSRIAQLQELVEDVKTKIYNIEGINKDLYLSPFPKVEEIVKNPSLGHSWNTFKPTLTELVMFGLAHCAELLSRYNQQPIEQSELVALKKDIETLSDKIGMSDINVELKTVILDQLEIIRRAIAEYKIRGAEGIRDGLATCYGKLIQNEPLFRDPETSEHVASLWDIFSRADNMTTVALNLISIGTTAANILHICQK